MNEAKQREELLQIGLPIYRDILIQHMSWLYDDKRDRRLSVDFLHLAAQSMEAAEAFIAALDKHGKPEINMEHEKSTLTLS